MADVILNDGREIVFDLGKICRAEYRALFDVNQKVEDESAIIARVAGLEFDAVHSEMSIEDWKRLSTAFFKKCREPLADPNSASASSSHSI